MADNDWKIRLTAGLDGTQSRGQINSDIKGIARNLEKLKLYTEIDKNQVRQLQNQLKHLQVQLNNITVSDTVIKGLVQKINAGLQGIRIDNIDIGNIGSQMQQTGQQAAHQFTQGISQGLNNSALILDSFRKSLANIGMGSKEIAVVADRIQNLDVQIESLNQSITRTDKKNILAVDISGTDKLGQAIKLTEQYNITTGDLIKSIDSVSAAQQKAGAGTNTFAKQQSQAAANLTNQINQLNRAANDKNASRPITDASHLSSLSSAYNDIISAIQKMGTASSNTFVEEQNNVKTLISNYKSLVSEFKNAESIAGKVSKIKLSYETGGYDSKIETLITRTNQWTDAEGNARISTEALQKALNNLSNAYSTLSAQGGDTATNQKALIEAERELDVEIKKVQNSVTKMNATMMKSSAVDSLKQKVQEFYDKNSASHRKWGNELQSIISELKAGEVSLARGQELEQKFIGIQNAARQAGKLGKSLFQTLKDGAKSFSYWTSSTFIVMKTIAEVRQAISSATALDTALTDLRKTAKMSAQELEEFYYSANDTAKQMGVTTQEILEQAAAWSRLGYSTAEKATQMAKLSSQFALISPGMDVDTATSGLVSIMKAYDIEVNDVLDGIESKINIIGNNLALSNDNIVSMLQDSVSAMAEGRNTLEETIALESAAYEIVQNDSVGNGFKTVSLRLRGLNEETQELDDSLKTIKGDLYDLTGISIMEDADTYKSTYQILKEISEVWSSLTDTTRAEALELMFGKLRSNVGAAVLKNFSAAERAMDLMANSAGNAASELSVAMDSIEYKANRLKETGTGIAQNLFGRAEIKTALDGINSLASGIDWLTDKIGLLGSIGFGAGIFSSIKNVGAA